MCLPRKARTLGNELKLEWRSPAHTQMCARKLTCLYFLQIHLNLIANYHFTGNKKNSVSFPQATFPPSIYTRCVDVSGTQGQVPLPRVHPAWDAGQHYPLVRTEGMSAWGTRPSLSEASSPCRVLSGPAARVYTKLWPPNFPCPLSSLDFPSICQPTQHHLFNESRI